MIFLEKGLVHIYFGDGKGKTSSALGLALRFLGWDKRVLLVQFMKKPQKQFNQFGEIVFLQKFISIEQFGSSNWVFEKNPSSEAKSDALLAFSFLKEKVCSSEYDLIIADELLYCLDFGVLSQQQIIDLIKSKNPLVELVITGSHKSWQDVFSVADYVTEIKKIKHPFDLGVLARKGSEY